MDIAERILEKHINENDLNFIFHEKKDLWQELLNATNEALDLSPVVASFCPNCQSKNITLIVGKYTYKCKDCYHVWAI